MTATSAYRRYWNAYRIFHRLLPWLWFAGIGLLLLVALLGGGDFWLAAVCALTIYPAIIGWLLFNGVGILIKMLPRVRRRRAPAKQTHWLAWALLASVLLLGVTFASLAVWLLIAVVRKAVA